MDLSSSDLGWYSLLWPWTCRFLDLFTVSIRSVATDRRDVCRSNSNDLSLRSDLDSRRRRLSSQDELSAPHREQSSLSNDRSSFVDLRSILFQTDSQQSPLFQLDEGTASRDSLLRQQSGKILQRSTIRSNEVLLHRRSGTIRYWYLLAHVWRVQQCVQRTSLHLVRSIGDSSSQWEISSSSPLETREKQETKRKDRRVETNDHWRSDRRGLVHTQETNVFRQRWNRSRFSSESSSLKWSVPSLSFPLKINSDFANNECPDLLLLFLGVTVKGQRHEQAYSFRLEDKGAIHSIKFNPDLSVLAIKHNGNSVEFLNFAPIPQTPLASRGSLTTNTIILQPEGDEYSQLPKNKSAKLYDFYWLTEKEIVFVTDQSIDHYVITAEKRLLRMLKPNSVPATNWQLFSREMNLLLVSAGTTAGNSLVPFSFSKSSQQQQLTKLPKFEVDLPQVVTQRSNSVASNSSGQSSSRRTTELTERDCLLATIYGKSYLLVIRQVFRVAGECRGSESCRRECLCGVVLGQGSVEVVLYHIDDDNKPAQKRHILRLSQSGKCALNVVDNLILIHHQPSKTTYVYDIEESSTAQTDGFQTVHEPLLSALSIQPVLVNWQSLTPSLPTSPSTIELYSSTWIVFLPNVIIDGKMGCLWYLSVHLDYLLDLLPDRLLLIDILLRRSNGKASIITLLRTLLSNIIAPVQIDSVNVSDTSASAVLDCWIEIIHRINRVLSENAPHRPLVDQSDVSSVLNLFSTIVSISSPLSSSTTHNRSLSIASNDALLDDSDQVKLLKFAISIVIEYIRSLNDFNIPVQFPIYELLVNLLMKNNQFFQLQQLIQYQVLTDSLQLGKRRSSVILSRSHRASFV